MDNYDDVQLELTSISKEIAYLLDVCETRGAKPSPQDKARFKALKERISLGAKVGSVTGENRELTDSEEAIFQPTLQNASFYFKAPSNAASDKWGSVLGDVQCSIETSLTVNMPPE